MSALECVAGDCLLRQRLVERAGYTHNEGGRVAARRMGISVGTRLGPYEIVGALGAGAMGEVYRARDGRLERDVAIKVIPDALALDAERLARFTREAQVLAALNHANIAAVYGLEHDNGRQALVLELVEGTTLAERIARQPIPLDEALAIARQIAEGLEAAHERGIVHRDLKPANVMVTPSGIVKVLDFGLARSQAASVDTDRAPVLATMPGAIVGTPQYMAPEQALGQPADRSADVWAFGCVLYEMLTGQYAFNGSTTSEILASVLKSEPDWRQLPRSTPDAIRRLLRRSLEKKHAQRLCDMRSVRLEIDDALADTPADSGDRPIPSRRSERLAWVLSLTAVALVAGVVGRSAWRVPAPAPEFRLEINTPPSRDASIALSPDGRRIAFVAAFEGQPHVWLRSLDSTRSTPLPGTAGATRPFWSADGRSIGFYADTRLRRIGADGRSLATIRIAELPMGGAWNADDTIILATRNGLPLSRVAASGDGEPSPVTGFEAGHDAYLSPQLLPDGQHFIFFATGRPDVRGVHIARLDRIETRRLLDADSAAVYASTGHLLFVRENTLLAQRFDAERLELVGEPFAIVADVNAGAALSASAAGPIAYRTLSSDSGDRQLVWVDRTGTELERVVYPDSAALGPALSPDGRYAGVFRLQDNNMDVWTYDRQRSLWDRITVASAHEIYALWSADGARLVFASSRNGRLDVYSKPVSAPAGQGEELLLSTPEAKWPMDLRRDGQFLLYTSLSPETSADIWALPLAGERTPFEVVRTEFYEQLPQFSPDGEWIAYQSDRTGRPEIYLRRFQGAASDIRVSSDGGGQPRFSPDGRELFYVASDDWLMAVALRADATGTLEPGSPERLFMTDIGSTAPNTNRHQYAVSPDGRSFLLNSVAGDANVLPITVILNWAPDR